MILNNCLNVIKPTEAGFVSSLNSKIVAVKAESILLSKVFLTPLALVSKLNYFYSSEFLLGYYAKNLKRLTFPVQKIIVKKYNFNSMKYLNNNSRILKKLLPRLCVYKKRLLHCFAFKKKKRVFFKVSLSLEFLFCLQLYPLFLYNRFRTLNKVFRLFYRKKKKKKYKILLNFLSLQNVGFLHFCLKYPLRK